MAMDVAWKAELRASNVIQKLKITKLPVDPFVIADAHDIMYEEKPSLMPGISGCLMKVGDAFGIIYSTRFTSEGFKRFTVGHELGHYFLDGHVFHLFGAGQEIHQSESGFISVDSYEREADAFAAGLLMPKGLFKSALGGAGQGLHAVEFMASKCRTSLTATAIRYAFLTDEPVAVVCSTGQKVEYTFMSKTLQDWRGLTWLRKGTGLPPGSLTARVNQTASNVIKAQRVSGDSSLEDWFDGKDIEIQEDVVGLGEYGRTLTVLWVDSLPDPSDTDEDQEDDDESLLPSERFYRKTRY